MSIEIVFPPISEDQVSKDLRHLTKAVKQVTGDYNVRGILGGEFGYGEEYKNDVFEMHPFYWGDCTCGWETLQFDFEDATPHEKHCYQSELKRRNPEDPYTEAAKLADEYGIPHQGCAIYCDCSYKALETQFYIDHPDHLKGCKITEPNFVHYASGFEVSWYKYIGRGMEVNKDLTLKQWASILEECLLSLKSQ